MFNLDDSNFLEIKVIDNGCGIKVEDQQKLFKLFGYLQDNENLNTQGVGLGLYVTKKIVKEFGGEVGVNSIVG